MASSTLTAAELTAELTSSDPTIQAAGKSYLFNHLNDEPPGFKITGGFSIPNPVSGIEKAGSTIADIGKVLGNLQLWKGLGLVIAGVIILIIIGVAAVK